MRSERGGRRCAVRVDVDVAGLPYAIEPMLAVAGDLPNGPGWAWEWKFDGFRCCYRSAPDGTCRLTSRGGNDLTGAFPDVAGVFAEVLHGREAVLDGELVVLNDAGRPDFGLVQIRHQRRPRPDLLAGHPAAFYAFDLLMLRRSMLLDRSFEQRREALEGLGPVPGPHAVIPPSYRDVDPQQLLDVARQHHLEGLVAKRLSSRYLPGRRSRDWIKFPLVRTQDALICGWRPGNGNRTGTIGSLVLGAHDNTGQLQLIGDVGSGFSRHALADLKRLLAQIPRADSPFPAPIPAEYRRGTHWVELVLVGEVAYRAWTRDGRLRHVSWRGWRIDLTPAQVVIPSER